MHRIPSGTAEALKLKFNGTSIKTEQRLSGKICIRLFSPLNLETFHTPAAQPLPYKCTHEHKQGPQVAHKHTQDRLVREAKNQEKCLEISAGDFCRDKQDVHCPEKHVGTWISNHGCCSICLRVLQYNPNHTAEFRIQINSLQRWMPVEPLI